jgi:hypothetical protein
MKALTLHQPWASLIAYELKTIETRSWTTSYRGPIAIHAGAKRAHPEDAIWKYSNKMDLPQMAVVATAYLDAVLPMEQLAEVESALQWRISANLPFGDFRAGRYAWWLTEIVPITPIPARGHHGLWEWEMP